MALNESTPVTSGCGAQADLCVDKVLQRDEDQHVALVHLTGHADLPVDILVRHLVERWGSPPRLCRRRAELL